MFGIDNKPKICVFNLPIEWLHPHPHNPRKDLGDLSELVESIKAVGIKQNLTVVPDRDENGDMLDDSYTVIIGHRRMAAAKAAGFKELPCAIDMEITPAEQIALMLHENMQRRQLTPLEEGLGFQQLQLEFGWPVGKISEYSGFSETTVRNRLRLTQFDKTKVKKAYEERQPKLVEFEALSKVKDEEKRNELLEKIGTFGFMTMVQTALEEEAEAVFMESLKTIPQLSDAVVLSSVDTWNSCKYKRLKSIKVPDDGVIDEKFLASLPTVPNRQRHHYIHFDRCAGEKRLTFYTKVKPVKQESSKEALQRRENIAKAWADLEALGRKYYQLRKNFVENFYCRSNEQIMLVLQGAVFASVSGAVKYYNSSERLKEMEKILGIEPPDANAYVPEAERTLKLIAKIREIKKSDVTSFVYQLFTDSDEVECYGWNTKNWPVHSSKRPEKIALYAWLESLGFETSDEEKALLDGSHEVFHRGGPMRYRKK